MPSGTVLHCLLAAGVLGQALHEIAFPAVDD